MAADKYGDAITPAKYEALTDLHADFLTLADAFPAFHGEFDSRTIAPRH
ncbi:MAG: hypothetical protein K8U57_32725 [Planctomycetes bacterium]|nr:hypothetical protein [Planctomycetota bacterium]